MGMHWIDDDPNWRTTYPNGVWEAERLIGNGTYTLEGTDPDGLALDNNDSDPLVLTGIGFEGDARYKLEVTLTAETQGLTCLEVALHAGTDLSFSTSDVQCNQTISANNSVSESGNCNIFSDVEAVNAISGDDYLGTNTTGITPRTMPDSTVFDYYLANGTTIDYASLPSSKDIAEELLSPDSNPYGPTTNPEGIYVIDCAGAKISIKDSRIVGTLVLLNTGSNSEVRATIHWEPAVANYPALLVSGVINFNFNNTTLSEPIQGTNFNPPGTPYPYLGGTSNTTKDDTYPSMIKGLVYVSGDASADMNHPVFDGVLVVGSTFTVTLQNDIDLTYRSTFLDNPPPGFGAPPKMVLSPGSWEQVVD